MMDADDVENGSMPIENIVVPATKRQNRWFACAATLCLSGAAAVVLTKNYTSPAELPIDIFDDHGGTVGQKAPNARIQEAVDKAQEVASATHHSLPDKNPFKVPYQDHTKHKYELEDMINLRRNRTDVKQKAALERWSRTHPGEAFPSRFNSTIAHGPHSWTGDAHNNSKNPLWYKEHSEGPTKTSEDPDKEEAVEDGHHQMDPHGDEIIHDDTVTVTSSTQGTSPASDENQKIPTNGPSNVFGGGGQAASEEKNDTELLVADTPAPPPDGTDATEHGPSTEAESTEPPVDDTVAKTDSAEPPATNIAADTDIAEPPVDDTPADSTESPAAGNAAETVSAEPPVEETPATEDTAAAPEADGTEEAGITQDPTNEVRQEIEPNNDKAIAEKVLKNEEAVETEGEATDTGKSDAQDVGAWHAGKVSMGSGIKFEIIQQLEHDHNSFTQGLTYANGKLYESAGLYGKSTIRILDPETGKAQQVVPMKHQYFAEGMTFYDNKLVQIVWKLAKGFVYNANDLTAPPVEYNYTTVKKNEGWGITYDTDRHELIVTDGSANLVFWDPDCWKTGRCDPKPDKPPIPVTRLDGSPANELNEIEYWRGRVIANVWYSDVLLVINPETGKVEKEYDFGSIFPRGSRPKGTDVFNGISVTDDPDILYVTGKKWDRMFKVKLLI